MQVPPGRVLAREPYAAVCRSGARVRRRRQCLAFDLGCEVDIVHPGRNVDVVREVNDEFGIVPFESPVERICYRGVACVAVRGKIGVRS